MVSAGPAILLFVPADRPDRFRRAVEAGADAVIIDLEDAAAATAKEQALANLAHIPLPDRVPLFVRINAIGSAWHEAEISSLAVLRLAGVMLPKAEDPAAIETLAARLGHPVIALIETAAGLAAARAIAAAEGVTRLAFGSIDYAADLDCAHTREALLTARAEIVLASRLARRAAPIDGITISIDDADLITDDARYAASLGFGAKLCIHPKQIGPAAAGLAPSEAEIAWANRVLAHTTDRAEKLDGTMVDAPVRRRAAAVLRRVPRPN